MRSVRAAVLLAVSHVACGGGGDDVVMSPDGALDEDGMVAPSAPDCTGAFGSPEIVLEDPLDENSIALTGDELEMFYVRSPMTGEPGEVAVSRRSSTSERFAPGVRVEEIEAACASAPDRTLDVTEDGLRLYFGCVNHTSEVPIQLAARSDRSGPFVVIGSVGNHFANAAVDSTELVVFQNDMTGRALFASRATKSEPFATWVPVPGLEGVAVVSPVLADDALTLFSGITGAARPTLGFFQRSTPGGPFGPLVEIALTGFAAAGGPDPSPDCRRVYFIGIDEAAERRVYVLRR